MKLHSLTYLLMFTLSAFLVGCGGDAPEVEETPEVIENMEEEAGGYSGGGQFEPGSEEAGGGEGS